MSGPILVIKHGALGDFVLATGPFASIRKAHPDARIVLLTTPPFLGLGRATGWFDEVWSDERAGLRSFLDLRRRLAAAGFARVYDLQTSHRTGWYFRLWPRPRPEWSGIAPGCSHPHVNPERRRLHTAERQAEQLRQAGIAEVLPPTLDWAQADLSRFDLNAPYALLVPGGAAHRPAKRWPVEHYAGLARRLAEKGRQPVAVGGPDERPLGAALAAAGALDLTGETAFEDLAALARGAALAVGNDTGPMHVAAVAGAPCLVLFSAESAPHRTAPRGPKVAVLQRDDLSALSVAEVLAALPA